MTDLERKNFLHFLATRPPGKRQVKPNFEYLNALAGGEDESDEEFHGPEGSVGSDEEDNSDSDESGSDEEEDDESGQPSTSGKEEEDVVIIPPDEEADFKAGILKPGSSIQAAQLLCSICLNLRESMKNDPVIQCDKCGVAVHEICYMVEDFNEVESQDSSATTEPWFCEPCLFGLAEPPFCELCPNRYGAFKRADVGGQWVHLACALYTPGITFGDVDRYSAVSWQEIDHRNFGRKACVACTNRLEARTGITTQCEAAMCKNYYHITCAQKLGLLINAENNEQNYHDLPPLYLLCKKHSNSDYTRTKREAYARLVQQEENRFVTMKRHLLDGRELRKKERQKENYIKRMQSFEGSTIIWPDHDEKEKRGRLIQTSAQFLESFAEKAELAGVEKNDFEKAFAWIPTEQLPIMPPAFTDEFFRFYNHRETNVIPEEETRLSDVKKKRDAVLKEQRQLEQAIKESNEKSPGKRQQADVNKVRLSKFYNVLINLGVKKVKKPKTPSPIRSPQPSTSTSYTATKVLQKHSFVPKTKPNILRRVPPSKIGNMNVKITEAPLLDTSFSPKSIPKLDLNGPSLGQTAQLNGVYSPLLENSKEPLKTKNRPKIYESLGKPPSGNKNSSKTRRGSKLISSPDSAMMKPPVLDHYPRTSTSSRAESRMSRNDSVADKVVAEEIINECFKCKKNTDQHLLIYCNTCKHHCHLGCLDPPLKKMPKLDKNALWECADCAFPSEDEAEIEEVVKEDPDSTIASRRPKRDRSNALLEKRKLEEAETNRAFRSVMSQNRHKRPRISSTLNSSTLSKTSSAIHSPTPKKSRVEMEKSENTVEELDSSQDSQEL